LDRIDKSPHTTQLSRNKLVYSTLTWISSNKEFKGNPLMQISKGLISRISGLSIRTVFDALVELEQAGVIGIQHHFDPTKKKHDPSTYTLLSFGKERSGDKNHTPMATEEAHPLPTVLRKETKPRPRATSAKGRGLVSGGKKNRHAPKPPLSLEGSGGLNQPIQIRGEEKPAPQKRPESWKSIPPAQFLEDFPLVEKLRSVVLECRTHRKSNAIGVELPRRFAHLRGEIADTLKALRPDYEVQIKLSNP
jgi:hypothetical protein